MKFLITGGKGFIGKQLTKIIPDAIAIDSKDCDIRDYKQLKGIITKNKITHIIHLAAIVNPAVWQEKPELAWSVNVDGTENILKINSELGIKTTIVSTALAYKEKNGKLNENDELKSDGNTYIKTKIECEKLAKKYNAIVIRIFDQEGPGRQDEYFTSKVINSAKTGEKLELWHPEMTREFMDVRDGANGIKIIAQNGKAGETYNLCTGEGITKMDYIKLVEKTLGKKIDYTIEKNDDKTMLVGNNTKLKSLGWKREYTIEQTIKDQANSEMIKLMKKTFYKEKETKKELCDYITKAEKLSMGEKTKEFEKKFGEYQKRTYSTMYNSGSSANLALIQSLINLGKLKKDDKIGFSAITWATNVMPLIQLGLKPVPIDVNLNTLNIDSKTIKETIKKHQLKAIFLTNLLGFASDINKIEELCKKEGILLIEDNCESLGSEVNNKKLGNYGYASTFSFFVGHHMSTIEGGMVCTDDPELDEMLKMVRAHGWTRDTNSKKTVTNDFYERYTFYYTAYNLRPTEINAFIGLTQLRYIDEMNKKRKDNYEKFSNSAKDNNDFYQLNTEHMNFVSNFAYPVVCKDKETFKKYRQKFEENNVEIRPIVGGAMTEQPFYKEQTQEECANAKLIHEQGFYFPNNPELTSDEVKKLCSLLKK